MSSVLDTTSLAFTFYKTPKFLNNAKLKGKLTPTAQRVYTLLVNRYVGYTNQAQKEGRQPLKYVVYARKNLAKELGVNEASVTRAIQLLEELGLVEVEATPGRANRYYIVTEHLNDLVATEPVAKCNKSESATSDITVSEPVAKCNGVVAKCNPIKTIYINNTSSNSSCSNSNTDTTDNQQLTQIVNLLTQLVTFTKNIDSRLTSLEQQAKKETQEREPVQNNQPNETEKEPVGLIDAYFECHNMSAFDMDMFDVVIDKFEHSCKEYLGKPYKLSDNQKIKLYSAYTKINSDEFSGLYFITTAIKNARKSRIFRSNGLEFLLKNMDKAYNDEWIDRDWINDKYDAVDEYYQSIIEGEQTEQENENDGINGVELSVDCNSTNVQPEPCEEFENNRQKSNQGESSTDRSQQPINEPTEPTEHKKEALADEELEALLEEIKHSRALFGVDENNETASQDDEYHEDSMPMYDDDEYHGDSMPMYGDGYGEVAITYESSVEQLTKHQEELLTVYADVRQVVTAYLNHDLSAEEYQWLNTYLQTKNAKNKTLKHSLSI